MSVFDEKSDATSVKVPLHPNKVIKKTIESVISNIFLLIIIGVFLLVSIGGIASSIGSSLNFICIPIILILFVIYLGTIYWYQKQYLKAYYYDITKDMLVVRKGVWFKNQISFNFSRVQDVYVDQDMLDKLFGLYDVHLATAAITSGTMAHIDGLDDKNATKIRDMLLEKIKKANKGQGL